MLDPQNHGVGRPSSVRPYVVFAALLIATIFLWRGNPVAKLVKRKLPAASTPAPAETRIERKVYLFSVIYGGAYSGEELARARKVDDVVARHYAGFGSSPAILRMPKDTFMYVSYRRSNRVFWTKAKHRIPKGETVLYDGNNLARTRCGNRLSPKPQAPMAAGQDPTEEALDFPDKPKALLATASPVPVTPDADFFVPANSADLVSSLSPSDPTSPPVMKTALAGGGPEKPYAFGSFPGSPGPFLGKGLVYPPALVSSSSGITPSAATANSIPENSLIIPSLLTPEPNTLPMLFLAILLGSPTLVRRWRTRADTEDRNK